MVISDVVTDKEVNSKLVSTEKWCKCIEGALARDHYPDIIKKAGFENIKVLQERLYLKGNPADNRKITALVIKAVKPLLLMFRKINAQKDEHEKSPYYLSV